MWPRFAFACIAFVASAASVARAEDVAAYEVEGEADAAAADPRVAALDDAFARAATLALGELVSSAGRKAHKPALDREIIGRARLWVARFSVTKDATDDGRRQLTVVVRVDRDKMRSRLDELDITIDGGAPTPSPGTAPASAKRAVVLLRVADATERVRASYGAAASQEVPGLAALSAQLRRAGFAIKRAPVTGPVRASGEVPLADDEAAELAVEAKVDHAAVAGVRIGDAVPVRGMDATATLVAAHIRLVGEDARGGTAQAVARGNDAAIVAAAIDRALVAAASDVLASDAKTPLGPAPTYQGDDTPSAEAGVVLIRVSAKTPYVLVAAELKYLAGAKGISRAELRRVSPAGWLIGVTTTESVQKIASIAKRAPTAGTSAQVRVVGEVVELALSGAP